MLRRGVAAIALSVAASLAACTPTAGGAPGETTEAISYAPIAPSLQADGDKDAYFAAVDSVVLPYCLPFLSAGSTTFTPGHFGNVTFGRLTGIANRSIAYGIYQSAHERAALVLVPGRTEPFAKYCELIYDLRDSGITVYAFDVRGQGWSDRLLPEVQKGYVDSFDNYVVDLEIFRETVVMATPHPKTVLFGHSAGGGAATLYLERHPNDFDAAILDAPMHQIDTAPYPEWVARDLAATLQLLGHGTDYAPGKGGDYDENAQFVDNTAGHSLARWTMTRRLMAKFPELKIGGPTVHWVLEAIDATHLMQTFGWTIATPFLLLQARQDEFVLPGGQDLICASANWRGKICTKVAFGDPALSDAQCDAALKSGDTATARRCAGHELLLETDGIRAQVEKAISDYIDQVTGVVR